MHYMINLDLINLVQSFYKKYNQLLLDLSMFSARLNMIGDTTCEVRK